MVMGLTPLYEGEEGEDAPLSVYSGDKPDIELPQSQKILYEEIKKTGKPIVFVNVSGSCIALGDQDENCNAVLQFFYPGAEGGKALADILFGEVSPSGRLPVTFYKSTDDLPDFKDYSMENRTYKFFKGDVVYPFGYGLTYSDITEDWQDENTAVLTNNGDYDVNYTVFKFEYIPHKNLCGFKKVMLKSGETKTVIF